MSKQSAVPTQNPQKKHEKGHKTVSIKDTRATSLTLPCLPSLLHTLLQSPHFDSKQTNADIVDIS